MARELSFPLNEGDLAWLKERYPQGYVERMIELHGSEDAENAPETPEEPEQPQGTPEGVEGGENGSEEPEETSEDEAEDDEDDEDILGDSDEDEGKPYDPSEHNVDDVVKHLASASDAEKSRILAAEASGKGRTTILNA